MCTLPEMRCSESFVLVGVIHNSSSPLTLLMQRASLLHLLGDALPCSMTGLAVCGMPMLAVVQMQQCVCGIVLGKLATSAQPVCGTVNRQQLT